MSVPLSPNHGARHVAGRLVRRTALMDAQQYNVEHNRLILESVSTKRFKTSYLPLTII